MIQAENRFGLYLVTSKLDLDHLNEVEPQSISVVNTPLLTVDDVVACSEADGSIKLTTEAFERFLRTAREHRVGTAVVAVCKHGQPIYLGLIWQEIWQITSPNLVFKVHYPLDERTIRISAGYPTRDYFSGKDPAVGSIVFSLIRKEWKAAAEAK